MHRRADDDLTFPNPYSVATPEGCEGWEEMYPYYAVFDERRREADENRFWFWNSMHFPTPHPAFDVICIDSPYQAVGAWQNRVFAVPPAMGIDYRAVNGYIYISANPVTDPAKIAERAEFFQARAGHYFANWSELYPKWRAKMEALIAELDALVVPELPEYEPDEVAFGTDRNTAFYEVLDAYPRLLRLGDLMWQHHFEFLLLGYGAYATFAELCKAELPDIPDQHIAQMVAGIDVLLFRPDAELRRLAALAIETEVDGAFVEGRTPAEIDAALAESEAGRAWLAELEKIKDPWFNMATGDGLTHYYRSWLDDPSIPYASLVGHVAALRAGAPAERPTEEIERERDRLAEGYGALLSEEVRGPWNDLLALVAHRVPLRRGAQVLLRLLVSHPLVEQGPRVRGAAGRTTASSRTARTSSSSHATRSPRRSTSWCSPGRPAARRSGRSTGRRSPRGARSCWRSSASWTPPPALGVVPEAINDPMTIMLWGVTTDRVREWARQQTGGSELNGAAASPGIVEGPARVVRSLAELAEVREGEILVCGSTSPAWAPIFNKIRATVTDVGGVMSHAAIVCREYGLPAVVGTGRATSEIRTGQPIRVDGSTGVVTLLRDE